MSYLQQIVVNRNSVSHTDASEVALALYRLWMEHQGRLKVTDFPRAYCSKGSPAPAPENMQEPSVISRMPLPQSAAKRPPPWYLGLSEEFKKSVADIDRKLQGRILEAITKIEANPTTQRGDTVKPLRAEFKGCWRYRIGDFRLVYFPDQESGNVTLLTFAPRGAAYGD